ncbi:NAD(P)-binding domain-containing protein [Streptomyces sp. NPDC051180]|uniref:flavin-containing monooxygenase n=1 Tax=Streptomyces sp. NPDC051180 TaxID=3155797 RepID=UPI00345046E9
MATTPRSPHVEPPAQPVYVIGGGPGGLAVAAALGARGVRAVVLEKSDAVGASWRTHYDRLRLHTTRRLSALPGLGMPRSFGRWVARADVVRYLEKYTEQHELEVVTGVEVFRVERVGTEWILHATGGRRLTARAVVVATGYNHTPRIPDWPGLAEYAGGDAGASGGGAETDAAAVTDSPAETGGGAETGAAADGSAVAVVADPEAPVAPSGTPRLVHAREYRNPEPYRGKDVLVVGAGNTGAEIAADLAGGGAARVRLAIRTVPHIVRRTTAGWPAQRTGILVRRLPVPLVDRMGGLMARFAVPDLSAYGLPRPTTGLATRQRQGAVPVQDVGLIDAVRAGTVEIVAAVDGFDAGEVLLADGTRVAPDSVIAATGYRRGLEPLLGHLDVLDATGRPVVHGARTARSAPGLYFTGFTNPISGMFRELALDAERIARRISKTKPHPATT